MSLYFEALEWLNEFDRSHISGVSESLLALIRRTRGVERNNTIKMVLAACSQSPDPLEYPEVLLKIAGNEANEGRYENVAEFITLASEKYSPGSHRHAITVWLAGCVDWALNTSGFEKWKLAALEFDNLRLEYEKEYQDDRAKWYKSHLLKMGQLKARMVCSVDGAYSYIYKYDQGQLSIPAVELLTFIKMKLAKKERDITQALKRLVSISESAENYLERADTLVECGRIANMAGARSDAIFYLQKASALYLPRSHRQAVARWMLGALHLEQPNLDATIQNWNNALEYFLELAEFSDHKNWQDRKIWYSEMSEIMRFTLKLAATGKLT